MLFWKNQRMSFRCRSLIPRYEGDNAGIAAWKQGTLEDAVKEQIIESVTAELKA